MEDILRNGVICPIPWVHLSLFPDGKTLVCPCQSDYSVSPGNYNSKNISDLINSEVSKNLRKDMLNGTKNSICDIFYFYEKNDRGISPRTNFIKEFKKYLVKGIINTDAAGFIDPKNFEFVYWDVRLSNLCNLKCRTCLPYFSSSILDEYKKIGWYNKHGKNETPQGIDINVKNNMGILDELIKYIYKVKIIHFAGGEPILMKEHWILLDELLKNERFDVNLHYQTNLMKLDYKGKHVFELWKKFKKYLIISPSIDAIGDKLSYIRSNSNWEILNSNLLKLLDFKKEYKNIKIIPTITISVFNVLYICDLINYLCSIKIKIFKINIVRSPEYYHVSLIPDNFKKIIERNLDTCQKNNNLDYKTFDIIKNEIYNKDYSNIKNELLTLFKKYTNRLDEFRGQNFAILFPELIELLN